MRRALIPALVLSLVLALSGTIGAQASKPAFKVAAATQPVVRKSADTITEAQLKDYLSFIASDDMEGRDTPSRGLNTTANFIATLLSRWGAKPAGDDATYLQKIALTTEKLDATGTQVEVGAQKFVCGKDFYAAAFGGTASGAMVFAGDGWYVKAKNIDAYKDVDPKGKIVVLTQAGGLPAGVTIAELMAGKPGEDWTDPMSYAQKKGAVGIIALVPLMVQVNPDALENLSKQASTSAANPDKLPRSSMMGRPSLPAVMANAKLAQAIFAGQKVNATTILTSFAGGPATGTPIQPFALSDDRKITINVKTTKEKGSTQNVVAVIEGSDPVLKGEYVALGAHYDHVGTGTPVTGDSIRNGADDDGSGTVALLAIAEALSKAPRHPKRSVLFVWHMGEEKGLWGSRYFTAFPTVPIDKIVTQLNIDMIGRSKPADDKDPRDKDLAGPNEVYVIGSKMMSTELGALSEAVNDSYLKLSLNYKYDDPKDPERFFYRSDHINYATKNIPIIFYFTGVHRDYHQPGDEVSKIDFKKFEKITRTIYGTLWEVGEMKTRPKVDKPLPANVTSMF